jgi:hypothetical protein
MALGGAACGPIKSTPVLIDADVELSTARAAGAQTTAPYEYTSAEAYLHKAREQAAHSQYELAIANATRARELAKVARAKAVAAPPRALPSEPASPAESAPSPSPSPSPARGEPEPSAPSENPQ